MTEEEKKTIIGDLYEKLNKSQQAAQHQSVLDHTDKSNRLAHNTHTFRSLASRLS